MRIAITAKAEYLFDVPTDILLQIEAAAIPEQIVESTSLSLGDFMHFARVPAQDMIGERIWLRFQGKLAIDYHAIVKVNRIVENCLNLPMVPPHKLPGETVQYLMASKYCQSDQFQTFVFEQFGHLEGGERIVAMRDWIHDNIAYVIGSSDSSTSAIDTFHSQQGVCRDFAHLMITFARACGIPARIASVYALNVKPQDFHAVAEVFLGGEWHLVDATGMAHEGSMAKIGVGRDAVDVAFLTAYGPAIMLSQSVTVEPC